MMSFAKILSCGFWKTRTSRIVLIFETEENGWSAEAPGIVFMLFWSEFINGNIFLKSKGPNRHEIELKILRQPISVHNRRCIIKPGIHLIMRKNVSCEKIRGCVCRNRRTLLQRRTNGPDAGMVFKRFAQAVLPGAREH